MDFDAILAPFWLLWGSQNGGKLGAHTRVHVHVHGGAGMHMHMYTQMGCVRASWGSKSTPGGAKKHPRRCQKGLQEAKIVPKDSQERLILHLSCFESLKLCDLKKVA